jgi:hypothetical protein
MQEGWKGKWLQEPTTILDLIRFGSWLGLSLCNLPLLSGSGDGKSVTPWEQ